MEDGQEYIALGVVNPSAQQRAKNIAVCFFYFKRSRAADKLACRRRRERLRKAQGAFVQQSFGGDDSPTAEIRKENPPLTEAKGHPALVIQQKTLDNHRLQV